MASLAPRIEACNSALTEVGLRACVLALVQQQAACVCDNGA